MDGRGRGRGRGRGAGNINLTQDQLTALINQAVGAYAANHPVHGKSYDLGFPELVHT